MRARRNGATLPPGPIGPPILGVFQVAFNIVIPHVLISKIGLYPFIQRNLVTQVDNWAKKFGPLYSLQVGNQLFMIVSDPLIVKDLMVTNGAVFSSRRDVFLRSRTILANRGITASPYGPDWRKHRRLANTVLNTRSVDEGIHLIEVEVNRMIKELIVIGQGGLYAVNPQSYAGRYSLNNMLNITFGEFTETINDPLVQKAFKLSHEFMKCSGIMANMSDFVTILQHVPNYMYERCNALHQDLVSTYGGMVSDMEKKIQRGEDVPECLAKTLIQVKRQESLSDLDIQMLVSAFMLGGLDSTASIIRWFFARMVVHPDIQRRAQDELDRTVGRSRLPVLDDGKNLPYIQAIIKEIERCHNPFWLCTPHAGNQDFTYRGYFIPKGTALVLNTYGMQHDPQRYPDPFRFNPDRYLELSQEKFDSNYKTVGDKDNWIFGVGRRVCPGIRLADHEIFLAITRMLWAFRMEEVPQNPINIEQYKDPAKGYPKELYIKMVPRHDKVAEMINAGLLPASV
ncbi:cytochrome P450 [Marasmius fiardii PR-910]|nr:cytochrome P450 [Marasmius fiardii PR-910]